MTIEIKKTFCPLSKSWGFTAIVGKERSWGFTRDEAKNRLMKRVNPQFPVMDLDEMTLYFPRERKTS
jgi:hypothetical protein